jgi:peptide-methionine (S)-S-oxide reductase
MNRLLLLVACAATLMACRSAEQAPGPTSGQGAADRTTVVDPAGDPPGTRYTVLAGGCFWCVEADFDKVDGVISTTSGYAGGTEVNPTYGEVGSGRTGHTEAVRIVYDSTRVSYRQLLEYFWRHHDPLTPNRQFCDAGPQYRAAIFYQTPGQRALADSLKQAYQGRFPTPIVTEIVPETPFYRAEDYHQDFYRTNPERYDSYRLGCRRDARIEQLWGTP